MRSFQQNSHFYCWSDKAAKFDPQEAWKQPAEKIRRHFSFHRIHSLFPPWQTDWCLCCRRDSGSWPASWVTCWTSTWTSLWTCSWRAKASSLWVRILTKLCFHLQRPQASRLSCFSADDWLSVCSRSKSPWRYPEDVGHSAGSAADEGGECGGREAAAQSLPPGRQSAQVSSPPHRNQQVQFSFIKKVNRKSFSFRLDRWEAVKKAVDWVCWADRQYPCIYSRLEFGRSWESSTRQLLGFDSLPLYSPLIGLNLRETPTPVLVQWHETSSLSSLTCIGLTLAWKKIMLLLCFYSNQMFT